MTHNPADPYCVEKKSPYNYIHCFSCGEDELIRFGVGFQRAYVICPGCYHSFANPMDLELADYEQRSNVAGSPVEKREPEDVQDCPMCGGSLVPIGSKRK